MSFYHAPFKIWRILSTTLSASSTSAMFPHTLFSNGSQTFRSSSQFLICSSSFSLSFCFERIGLLWNIQLRFESYYFVNLGFFSFIFFFHGFRCFRGSLVFWTWACPSAGLRLWLKKVPSSAVTRVAVSGKRVVFLALSVPIKRQHIYSRYELARLPFTSQIYLSQNATTTPTGSIIIEKTKENMGNGKRNDKSSREGHGRSQTRAPWTLQRKLWRIRNESCHWNNRLRKKRKKKKKTRLQYTRTSKTISLPKKRREQAVGSDLFPGTNKRGCLESLYPLVRVCDNLLHINGRRQGLSRKE